MEKNNIRCADCKMRRRYDERPTSFVARFWHWHTGFCPGWKAYIKSLTPNEQALMKQRYRLK